MKKTLLLLGVLAVGYTHAQKKVGINTQTPAETLEVNGTAKIADLPENETGKIYNGLSNTEKETTFNATKTVVADANGVLGVVDGLPTTKKKEQDEIEVRTYHKCTPMMTNTAFANARSTDFGLTITVGNYQFRFWRSSSSSAWLSGSDTVAGNYFQMKNTKDPMRFVAWTSGGSAFADNEEQDRGVIAADTWTRYTSNFNDSAAGDKIKIDDIYAFVEETGYIDHFKTTGVVIRFSDRGLTEPNVMFCLTVEDLGSFD